VERTRSSETPLITIKRNRDCNLQRRGHALNSTDAPAPDAHFVFQGRDDPGRLKRTAGNNPNTRLVRRQSPTANPTVGRFTLSASCTWRKRGVGEQRP
jgi:hypothetical protein